MQTTQTIKVAIADDHAIFRNGLKNELFKHTDLKVIGEAENGAKLLSLIRQIQPDVVLLDIQMPVMDGEKTLIEIKKYNSQIKVIMLSLYDQEGIVSKMMELGANSYLSKMMKSETIYETIIGVCTSKDGYHFNELIDKSLITGIRTKNTNGNGSAPEVVLTEKEVAILRLMCEEKSTKEIADIVELSPRTVEAIRDKMKTKTGTHSMAGLIMYAVKSGIYKTTEVV